MIKLARASCSEHSSQWPQHLLTFQGEQLGPFFAPAAGLKPPAPPRSRGVRRRASGPARLGGASGLRSWPLGTRIETSHKLANRQATDQCPLRLVLVTAQRVVRCWSNREARQASTREKSLYRHQHFCVMLSNTSGKQLFPSLETVADIFD
jgi:hypothetical protein